MCVLKKKLIDVFSRIVGGGTLRDRILTVLLGVYIGGAAREKNCLAGVN